MLPETERIIQVLKTSMRVLGFTQQDIEAKLGVAPGYVGRLFRGVMQLRFDHIVNIARAMDVEPEEIFQLAFAPARNPPSDATQRLRDVAERFHPPAARSSPRDQAAAGSTMPLSMEEETERIERIVLRTFEKFFASMAKNAGGRESVG